MDVEVLFTVQALNEASRMVKRWYEWPLLVLQNLGGAATMIAIMVSGCLLIAKSLFTRKPDFQQGALGLVTLVVPIALFWWLYVRERRRTEKGLGTINPFRLKFDLDGLHTFEKNGDRSFSPWSKFDGFREGKTVILLRNASKEHRFIPKNAVPPGDPEQIVSAIRARLPEIQ